MPLDAPRVPGWPMRPVLALLTGECQNGTRWASGLSTRFRRRRARPGTPARTTKGRHRPEGRRRLTTVPPRRAPAEIGKAGGTRRRPAPGQRAGLCDYARSSMALALGVAWLPVFVPPLFAPPP